jgi:hypothetical protein
MTFENGLEHLAADAAEPVDTNVNGHKSLLLGKIFCIQPIKITQFCRLRNKPSAVTRLWQRNRKQSPDQKPGKGQKESRVSERI